MRRLAIGLAVLCAPAIARADSSVQITLNDNGQYIADQIGLSLPDFQAQSEQKINGLFRLLDLGHALTEIADTGSFAGRDFGVDYAIEPGDVEVGFAASGAIASDESLSSDHVLAATLINYGGMAAVNLGRWHQPRWTVSGGGSYAVTTIRGLRGALLSAGIHGQLQALLPSARSNAQWTGLVVTTGVEYAHWSIGLEQSLETHIDVVGMKDHAIVHMSSTGTLTDVSETFTVPIEATTGVRLVHHFDLYAGGGLDLTSGSSTITAVLDSVLSINADHLPIGTAHITASGASDATPVTAHALAGIAIHGGYARGYLQGELGSGERSVSIGLRARF